MGRIIAIANQKGGVGKTTTAINLSACLAEAGQRVLMVDFDPQGNGTSGLGLEKGSIENTVYELLLEECTLEECITESIQEHLDVLPSDENLAGAEIELLEFENKEEILKKYLNQVKNNYDYVIIDCPPSLNILRRTIPCCSCWEVWGFSGSLLTASTAYRRVLRCSGIRRLKR